MRQPLGHLGDRVSALLDGQLPPEDEERAWAHVHRCHPCRDLVEREGWVKTRLAGLDLSSADPCPDRLKGSLLDASHLRDRALRDSTGAPASAVHSGGTLLVDRSRHRTGLAVLGTGALGAAMVGMLALGAVSGGSTGVDRRTPPADISPGRQVAPTSTSPATSPTSTPTRRPLASSSTRPRLPRSGPALARQRSME